MKVWKWNCTEVQIYWAGVRSTVSTLILRFSINSRNFTLWAALTWKVWLNLFDKFSLKKSKNLLAFKETLWSYVKKISTFSIYQFLFLPWWTNFDVMMVSACNFLKMCYLHICMDGIGTHKACNQKSFDSIPFAISI